jgi:hypothetical protein
LVQHLTHRPAYGCSQTGLSHNEFLMRWNSVD